MPWTHRAADPEHLVSPRGAARPGRFPGASCPSRLAGASLVWLLAAWQVPVLAQVRGEPESLGLCVLPARGADFAAVRPLTRQVLRQFAADPEARLVDVTDLVNQMSRPSRPDYLGELQKGLDHLSAGKYGPARRALARVLATMRTALAAVPATELAFVQLQLAAAELGAGRRAPAMETLRELFTWRPEDLPRLAAQEPPGWDTLVSQAKLAVQESATTSLSIESTPAGAEVSVDGRRLGATPVLAQGLVMGTHHVTVSLEGYHQEVMEVKLTGQQRALSLRMRPDPDGAGVIRQLLAQRPRLGQVAVPGLGDLGHRLGLERALLVVAVPQAEGATQVHAFLYDLTGERLVRRTSLDLPLNAPAEMLESLAIWRRDGAPAPRGPRFSPAVPAPSVPALGASQTPEAGPDRPWYRRWYVWVLVGGAVAAAVILPVTLVPRDNPASAEGIRITW